MVQVPDKLFVKDPLTSALGRSIVQEGLSMIDTLGMEAFTFRKLAMQLGTTESSLYRYFVSKHQLILYLVSLYWSGMESLLNNLLPKRITPGERIELLVGLVCRPADFGREINELSLSQLSRVVMNESSKAYLTKEVDAENKEGYFSSYKSFCSAMSRIVQEMAPDYAYPRTLVSTLVEGAHHERFFAEHLPSLTDFAGNPHMTEAYFTHLLKTLLLTPNGHR